MITGGFKGKTQEIEADELIERLHHLFPNTSIVGEYGMTELSSQMWSRSLSDRFMTPPWLKVVAVDPKSGIALPNGSVGQLKFIDLANHQTVLGHRNSRPRHCAQRWHDGTIWTTTQFRCTRMLSR